MVNVILLLKDILYRLGLIADYVVESGQVKNTHYRKWNSGIMEQWYSITTTSQSISNAYGNVYIGIHTWTFPIPFVGNTNPDAFCGMVKWGTGAEWGGVAGVSKTGVTLNLFDCFNRAAGTKCYIEAYAIGKWK